MIKKLLLAALLCCPALSLVAQQPLSSKEMLAICPKVSNALDLPDDAKMSLAVKLGQMVTQNGFGSGRSQFVITPNVVILDKQATATAPVKFAVQVEVSVYVVDLIENVVFGQTAFTVQGVDRLENKAVIQAINQISPSSSKAQTFMNSVRDKIIDYYNTRIPTLMTKAQALAERNDYASALKVLSAIPENVDQYPAIADQMTAMYKKMVARDSDAALARAKALVATKDYSGAVEALGGVDPASDAAKQVGAVVDQLKKQVDADEQTKLEKELREYEIASRIYDDKMELARIRAKSMLGQDDSQINASLNEWFIRNIMKK